MLIYVVSVKLVRTRYSVSPCAGSVVRSSYVIDFPDILAARAAGLVLIRVGRPARSLQLVLIPFNGI